MGKYLGNIWRGWLGVAFVLMKWEMGNGKWGMGNGSGRLGATFVL